MASEETCRSASAAEARAHGAVVLRVRAPAVVDQQPHARRLRGLDLDRAGREQRRVAGAQAQHDGDLGLLAGHDEQPREDRRARQRAGVEVDHDGRLEDGAVGRVDEHAAPPERGVRGLELALGARHQRAEALAHDLSEVRARIVRTERVRERVGVGAVRQCPLDAQRGLARRERVEVEGTDVGVAPGPEHARRQRRRGEGARGLGATVAQPGRLAARLGGREHAGLGVRVGGQVGGGCGVSRHSGNSSFEAPRVGA